MKRGSVAGAIYPHLKSERAEPRKPRLTIALAKGLIADEKRGAVSPLGGQARPEPKRPGLKW